MVSVSGWHVTTVACRDGCKFAGVDFQLILEYYFTEIFGVFYHICA